MRVAKRRRKIGAKGTKTKEYIKEKSHELFAQKGFKSVTMKDICERTGLSRGGLYRHYDSTAQIWEEMFEDLSKKQINHFSDKMKDGISAKEILEEMLQQLEEEMLDAKNSLSLAIYEFSDNCDHCFFTKLNEKGIQKWKELIEYGIERKEFRNVNIPQVIDIIIYSYQGVRMWSRVVSMQKETVEHIVNHIKGVLL